MARGGGWSAMPRQLSPALRRFQRHTNRQPDLGFRVMIRDAEHGETDWLKELEVE